MINDHYKYTAFVSQKMKLFNLVEVILYCTKRLQGTKAVHREIAPSGAKIQNYTNISTSCMVMIVTQHQHTSRQIDNMLRSC